MTIRQPDPSVLLSFRANLRACTACPLHKKTTPVPWRGDIGPEFCIIGEAPGRSEAAAGEPFIGPAGIRLQYLLRKAGINPAKTAFINAVACFPDGTPNQSSVDICRKWMRGQIAFIQPTYIITVGTVAFTSLRNNIPRPKLAAIHGKPYFWNDPPLPARPRVVMSTYHPSSALRSPSYQKKIEEDLMSFTRWIADGEVWPEECTICGGELYRYDDWGIGLCRLHASHQGSLFAESVTGS